MVGIARTIFKSDLIAGVFFTALSFLPFIFPSAPKGYGALGFAAAFYLGVLLISNFIIRHLHGRSIISLIHGSATNNRNFSKVAIVFGAFMGFIAADLGGLWYFPYWTPSSYVIIGFFLGGWAFYFIFLISCYEAMKLILDRLLPFKKRVSTYFSFEPAFYKFLLGVGVASLTWVTAVALQTTHFFTRFHWVVNAPKQPYLRWYHLLATFVGAFCICEYVEYRRKRSSLLKDTLHGYVNPLLAMVLVGTILALANEVQNLDVFVWRYANYPLASHEIFHVPLFIILVWPIHIIALVVFWRAFGNGSSSIVFANPKVLKTKRRASRPRKLALATAKR